MKRIAAIVLLAGLGAGCATTDVTKSNAMKSIPVSKAMPAAKTMSTAKAMPTAKPAASGVVQASATSTTKIDANVQQASGFSRVVGSGCNDCGSGGISHSHHNIGGGGCNDCGHGGHGGYGGGRGIYPAPMMGPAGAVAAVGAIGPGLGIQAPSGMRSAIRFFGPGQDKAGKVTWFAGGNYVEPAMNMPADYNFAQGFIYRLRVSGLPSRPGKVYYPTLEVANATLKSLTYLSHGNVPVTFSDEDLLRVDSGNMVVKVIYLPDSLYQDISAVGGAEEVVSTQLDPGTDPVAEAHRRGTILAVIRIGNINLENANSPAMDAPPMGMMPAPPPAPAPMPMGGSGPMSMAPAAMPIINTGTMMK